MLYHIFNLVITYRYLTNIYPAPHGFYKDTGEKAQVRLKEFIKLYNAGLVTRTVGVHVTPTITENSSLGQVAIIGPVKTVKIGKTDYKKNLKKTEFFHKKIYPFLTKLENNHLKLHYTGIMASEKNYKDFIIQRDETFPSFINLIGIDSPGMTSSMAIANYVEKLVRTTED